MTGASNDPAEKPASATASLDGYFYQLDVSVWIALELALARQVASEVILEPSTQEDLEADLGEDRSLAMVEQVPLADHRLIVQCKLRRTGPWKDQAFIDLLEHGTRRISAAERLKEARSRYLLVTNADVDGVARKVIMDTFLVWPPTNEMPKDIAKHLPEGASGRVAILSSVDQEKLTARIGGLLTERFRVPHSRVRECLEALRKEALARMRASQGGAWTRAELEHVIQSHDGHVGISPILHQFVQPTNFDELKAAFLTQHAVIIRGPSGTGKTWAAKALAAHLQDEVHGLEVVKIQGGPEKIDAHTPRGPVLFVIDDPWGKFRLEPSAEPWNDSLRDVLRTATSDRRFLITSRSDILKASGLSRIPNKWFVDLEGENYGAAERQVLFENRMRTAPRNLQPSALRYADTICGRLQTPLELDRFFEALREGPAKNEGEGAFIGRCLKEAETQTLESGIRRQVVGQNAWRFAAVVWGLLKARPQLSWNVIPRIQAALTTMDVAYRDGLAPYLNFLIAGRNLRQDGVAISYAHPRVEQGLEMALEDRPELANHVLGELANAYLSLDLDGGDWGTKSAARLIEAVIGQPSLNVTIVDSTQKRIDAWLAVKLVEGGDDFRENLATAAAVGSPQSAPAELARWLTHRREGKFRFMLDTWAERSNLSANWAKWVASDPASRAIAEHFVRTVLPRAGDRYPAGFAMRLQRLAGSMTTVFRESLREVLDHGYHESVRPLLAGALEDLEAFAPIVTEALDYIDDLNAKNADGLWLSIANHELNDDYANHISESRGEDYYAAEAVLEGYVAALREARGWHALNQHSEVHRLISPWLKATRDGAEVSEMLALVALSEAGSREADVWDQLIKMWRAEYVPVLRERLRRPADEATRHVLARAVVRRLCEADLLAIAGDMVQEPERVLRFITDLRSSMEASKRLSQMSGPAFAFANALPASLALPARALLGDSHALAASESNFVPLDGIPAGIDLGFDLAVAELLAARGHAPATRLTAVLSKAQKPRSEIIAAAVRAIGLAADSKLANVVESGLKHTFADVREEALRRLAEGGLPLPPELLALSMDKGSQVRKTLLKLLGDPPHPGHLETLVTMSADDWSSQSVYSDEADHPIALEAAKLLLKAEQIPEDLLRPILDTGRKAADERVARTLFEVLIARGGQRGCKAVLELALKTGEPRLHRTASDALWSQHEHIKAGLGNAIGVEQLQRRAPSIAIMLACVVGACAARERVREIAGTLAIDSNRRPLIIALCVGASMGDETLAIEMLNLLGDHASRILAAVNGTPMARDALDDLGDDVRVTEELLRCFPNLFKKRRTEQVDPSPFDDVDVD